VEFHGSETGLDISRETRKWDLRRTPSKNPEEEVEEIRRRPDENPMSPPVPTPPRSGVSRYKIPPPDLVGIENCEMIFTTIPARGVPEKTSWESTSRKNLCAD
jgi:hypothetical protein